jgi:hypothetical protein
MATTLYNDIGPVNLYMEGGGVDLAVEDPTANPNHSTPSPFIWDNSSSHRPLMDYVNGYGTVRK